MAKVFASSQIDDDVASLLALEPNRNLHLELAVAPGPPSTQTCIAPDRTSLCIVLLRCLIRKQTNKLKSGEKTEREAEVIVLQDSATVALQKPS